MNQPDLTQFGLTEPKVAEIDLYNRLQYKKRWRLSWILLTLIAIVLLVENAEHFWFFLLSFLLYGLPIMVTYYGLKKFFIRPHHLTKAVEEYQSKLREYNVWLVKTKVDYWYSLTGLQFEVEVTQLFKKVGYDAIRTKSSGDGGVDIVVRDENQQQLIIQCKAYKKPVGPHIIRDLYGTMVSLNVHSAMLINLSGFTKGVHEFAKGKNIVLWDVSHLISLQNKL